jgi:hypothetical protein
LLVVELVVAVRLIPLLLGAAALADIEPARLFLFLPELVTQ